MPQRKAKKEVKKNPTAAELAKQFEEEAKRLKHIANILRGRA